MALVFPSKFLCLLHALCKRRAVTRNRMENPTPPISTLAANAAKKGGERGKKDRGRRGKD